MAKALVIVESPAKAKTIAGFLGDGYVVESSIGHIRDLPRSAAEVPAAYKAEPWSRLGVDVDNDFKPLYVVSPERQEQVKRLRRLTKDASEIYLATDEDREGESIAWHLLEVLAPQVPVKRMVFHEITKSAIEDAIHNTHDLDRRLVDAQEARRILDRLYGYELSPVLWKKVMAGLSAGRVQSVSTRIVVERERERMAFRSATWSSLKALFEKDSGESLSAELVNVAGRGVATGASFDSEGSLDGGDLVVLDGASAGDLADALLTASFRVTSVEERPYRRSPAAPFITSTLQQEAARKLHFSAQRTMQVAQRLYEQGHITYMRTDSTTLSRAAIDAARAQGAELYGKENVSPAPRTYDRKVKNAQEAHEAIRPSGERFRTPESLSSLSHDERRVYELVWQRTLASQMIDATGVTARIRISGSTTRASALGELGSTAEFAASGTVITSPGFLRIYREDDDEQDSSNSEGVRLPELEADDRLVASNFETEEHATKPPARFTEASLVKRLEDLGVGRPSTYATIMQTILDRGYVWKKGTALVPSFTAFAVVGLLEAHFNALVDYGFTASMEDDLDSIAAGEEEAVPWLERFYFGSDRKEGRDTTGNGIAVSKPGFGLKQAVLDRLSTIDAREVNSIPIGTDGEGVPIVIRVGRYGPYVQRGDDRAAVPEDMAPDEVTTERAVELLSAPSGDRDLGVDKETGLHVLARVGRYGPYVQLGEAQSGQKPRTASLFKSMPLDSVSLEQALEVLGIPRTLGTDSTSGDEVIARNGRYGPYVQRGSDSRSLENEEALLTITLEEAIELFAQPKQRRFGRSSATAAKEIGDDPETGKKIELRQGRFGPYVTDGTLNASLRRGDSEESLTLERAAELLADKRAAGPAPARKRSTKRAPAKKTTAKKTTAKKTTAKKAALKKAATGKAAPIKAAESTD